MAFKIQKAYAGTFLVFNLVFAILMFCLHRFSGVLYLNKDIGFVFLLFVCSTLLMHGFVSGKTQAEFIRSFMLGNGLKLMIYLIVLVAFFLFKKEEARNFVIWFFIHYACFTVFETVYLMKIQKK